MTKSEKIDLVLSAIGQEWITYKQIRQKIKNQLSIGGISLVLSSLPKELDKTIERENERFGNEDWQTILLFRKLLTTVKEPELV
jgi:hypothetical protein